MADVAEIKVGLLGTCPLLLLYAAMSAPVVMWQAARATLSITIKRLGEFVKTYRQSPQTFGVKVLTIVRAPTVKIMSSHDEIARLG